MHNIINVLNVWVLHAEVSYLKLKFSPDWDSAADEFNKAAVCFKVRNVNM